MSEFNVGDIVVHKTAGNTAMVIIPPVDTMGKVTEDYYYTRRASGGGGTIEFVIEVFHESELESQIDSIDREAELFKIVSGKQKEINGDEPKRPIAINHLN